MKTHGNLWPQIASFENLWLAARNAAKGKRHMPNVNRFLTRMETHCWELREELLSGSYRPGPYHTFEINRPKRRMISAAPFRDRVVHHALCNVAGPLLERRFIADTFANRVGKGTHAAMDRYQQFCRRFRYLLPCDVRKYFPSIDHDVLKSKLRRVFRCRPTLALADLIIDGSNEQEPSVSWFPGDDLFSPSSRRRGLPAGNLTSQLLANAYLDGLVHFVKEELRCPGYLRYVDDFVLFSDDKASLWQWHEAVMRFLERDRLRIHANRCRVMRSTDGLRFLGFLIRPGNRRLARGNLQEMHRRLKRMRAVCAARIRGAHLCAKGLSPVVRAHPSQRVPTVRIPRRDLSRRGVRRIAASRFTPIGPGNGRSGVWSGTGPRRAAVRFVCRCSFGASKANAPSTGWIRSPRHAGGVLTKPDNPKEARHVQPHD